MRLPWACLLSTPVELGPNATLQARGAAGARNERRLSTVACKRLFGKGLCPGKGMRSLFLSLSWIVRWVDICDARRPNPVDLEDGLLFSPGEMGGLCRHHEETPRR
jgi:hypothetical protein